MLVHVEFSSENKTFTTDVELHVVPEEEERAIASVDIFETHPNASVYIDGDKDLQGNGEWYYNNQDIVTDQTIKDWFFERISREYQLPKIIAFEIEK